MGLSCVTPCAWPGGALFHVVVGLPGGDQNPGAFCTGHNVRSSAGNAIVRRRGATATGSRHLHVHAGQWLDPVCELVVAAGAPPLTAVHS